MKTQIDFEFIQQLEGCRLTGYVPDPEKSMSGVTIASGFDLGARREQELLKAFPGDLALKLALYAGLRNQAAVSRLARYPLTITSPEAVQINLYAKEQASELLTMRWASEEQRHCEFVELPPECQTVIASVAFQYGQLKTQTPKFWYQVTSGDWYGALINLRGFGDRYKTRRNKEADLLESWLSKPEKR